MVLTEADLNNADHDILDILADGRATPALVRTLLEEEYGRELSRQYVSQRMIRLAEHGHLKNVYDSGVYELIDNPREDASS
ncbi:MULTISPECIES: hypothetical protein [Halorussus]|uniref:hypothetical protein n=1 Tax=Halorussus TaxID=1070314 RepID=UPI000E213A69|nr:MULTISPECIES: hypothetical protein [Halorussus]NHN60125.1 winged helix-turn-helix domain-containing protein [Halorussus sp. JP-T4]